MLVLLVYVELRAIRVLKENVVKKVIKENWVFRDQLGFQDEMV